MACNCSKLFNIDLSDLLKLDELKKKVICEFQDLMEQIENGYKPDYLFILEEISLIELEEDFDLDDRSSFFVSHFYINNK